MARPSLPALAREWPVAAALLALASLALAPLFLRSRDRSAAPIRTESDAELRVGAENSFAEGRYPAAAALFRRSFERNPEGNLQCLFREAEALRLAGDDETAADAYAEFVARSAPGAPLAARATLWRARLFEELGRSDRALGELDRILSPDGVLRPDAEDWAEALLLRGRVALRDGPSREIALRGRRDLDEYVERYAGGLDHRRGLVEANLLLARARVADREWPKAMESLARVESAEGVEPEVRREAALLRGDALLARGLPEEALEAYGEAYRADLRSDDRLWGLMGRARAAARLGRGAEARRDYETAKSLYEERREVLGRTLAGRGRELWEPALEALGREVMP